MISLSLGRDLEQRLEEAADETGASPGEIIVRAVEQYLEFRESRLDAAREARAQADKGIFISQAKMHAWMDSWDTDSELPAPELDIFPAKPDA